MTNVDTVQTSELKQLEAEAIAAWNAARERGVTTYEGPLHAFCQGYVAAALEIRAEFDEVMKAWAEFRQEIRGHLFAFWPNNPGVGDDEIVEAVRRIAEEHKAQREQLRQAQEALEAAQQWLDELREEFRRGALEDRARRGGYLSNKNVEVEVQARKALLAWVQSGEERGKVRGPNG